MCNYYRKCLPHAAANQARLHDLLIGLTKKAKLKWTEEMEQAFRRCKPSIADAACTTFFDPRATLALKTDASDTAVGAVIEQEQADGQWPPLGFFSHSPATHKNDIASTTGNSWRCTKQSNTSSVCLRVVHSRSTRTIDLSSTQRTNERTRHHQGKRATSSTYSALTPRLHTLQVKIAS